MFDANNELTSKMMTDSLDVYGVLLKEKTSMAVLGAGQVDKLGNVNSTKLTQDLYLTGAGGGNDATSTTGEVLIVAPQAARRFIEKVYYISMPGNKVNRVVSTQGIFTKLNEDQHFSLTSYFPTTKGDNSEAKIQDIQANCGWQLDVADDLSETPAPSVEELRLLRLLDPEREFLS